MAKGSIKGITIQIGGDTTGLDKALKETNKKSRDLQSELREVDKALKLDPGNLTLVKQKQDLLSQSIKESSEKLKSYQLSNISMAEEKDGLREPSFVFYNCYWCWTNRQADSIR